MVSILNEKPSAFETTQDGDTYFKMHDDKGTYAWACLNFIYAPVALLHLEVARFSHRVLKEIITTDWPYCKALCEKNGCTIVSVDKEGSMASNKTWMKFVSHFGFEKFTQYTASIQIIGEENGQNKRLAGAG